MATVPDQGCAEDPIRRQRQASGYDQAQQRNASGHLREASAVLLQRRHETWPDQVPERLELRRPVACRSTQREASPLRRHSDGYKDCQRQVLGVFGLPGPQSFDRQTPSGKGTAKHGSIVEKGDVGAVVWPRRARSRLYVRCTRQLGTDRKDADLGVDAGTLISLPTRAP